MDGLTIFGREPFSSSVLVTETGIRLPAVPAIAFKLSLWNTANEPTFSLKADAGDPNFVADDLNEIYWGFKGVLAHQLFVSTSTDVLGCTNLQDVCLQTRPGQTATVWYSYWTKDAK